MSNAELLDLAEKGHRVGMQMKDITNEASMNAPNTLSLSPREANQMNEEHRRRFQKYFLPLLKRAQELSAEIIIQDPPEYVNDDHRNKQYADFFHKAINGYDYNESEGEGAANYLITISDNLSGKIKREEGQK